MDPRAIAHSWDFAPEVTPKIASLIAPRVASPFVKRPTIWEEVMRAAIARTGVLAAAVLAAAPVPAQETVRIGVILSYSGQFADAATQIDNGIKLYMKKHGDTVAGKKIEIIRKDTGGIAPDVAKRLAQELITRDKADIITGFALTPNALAAADISAEAKKFMVVMNAATSIITTKSPYMARTSVTTPQLNETFGNWAVTKGGIKKIYTMVSDYGPGHDAEGAFHTGFKNAGGELTCGQSGFLRLRATRQRREPRRDLHLDSGRRAACGGRQGARRARHRSEEIENSRAGGART